MSRVTQESTAQPFPPRKGLSPAMAMLSSMFRDRAGQARGASYYPAMAQMYHDGLGSSPFARHYWGNHCYFLLLQVLRCFSSLRSPHRHVTGDSLKKKAGLSHSEIRASTVICTYTRLIAAYHVLHRLREPRHPTCALDYFLMTLYVKTIQVAHTFSCYEIKLMTAKKKTDIAFLQFRLFQYVKDRCGTDWCRLRIGFRLSCSTGWRISGSNR